MCGKEEREGRAAYLVRLRREGANGGPENNAIGSWRPRRPCSAMANTDSRHPEARAGLRSERDSRPSTVGLADGAASCGQSRAL